MRDASHLLKPYLSTKTFTTEERNRLRSDLLENAASDTRIISAAITRSAADGREDQWSDMNLAFGVAEGAELWEVVADWTKRMYDERGALHHRDIVLGPWIYRIFLLSSTLQVNLAFVAAKEFRALTPAFHLVFGTANEAIQGIKQEPGNTTAFGWLYALHARSSIARGRFWQAEYMLSGMRDNALALACLRYGLPAVHGRMDQLPADVLATFKGCLVRELNADELWRAFGVAAGALLAEIGAIDASFERSLREVLMHLPEKPFTLQERG